MTDLFQKMLQLGLGLGAVTKEKAEAVLHELTRQGHLTEDEAHHVVDDLLAKGRASQEEITASLKQQVQKIVGQLDLPTREDLTRLEARLEALERRLTAIRR